MNKIQSYTLRVTAFLIAITLLCPPSEYNDELIVNAFEKGTVFRPITEVFGGGLIVNAEVLAVYIFGELFAGVLFFLSFRNWGE